MRRKLTEQHLFHRIFSHVSLCFPRERELAASLASIFFSLSFFSLFFRRNDSLKRTVSLCFSRCHHQSPRVLLSAIVKGNCATGEIRIKVTGRFLDNDGPHNRHNYCQLISRVTGKETFLGGRELLLLENVETKCL